MSNLLLYENTMKSQLKLFDDGLTKVKLKQLECQRAILDLSTTKILFDTLEQHNMKMFLKHDNISATQESRHLIKKKTLNDKLKCSKISTQATTLSKTLVPDLTGKEKGYCPFWNLSCQTLSNKLWLPTVTDSQDSALTFYNGSSKNIIAPSWFSIRLQTPIQKLKWQKTSSALSITSPQKIMVEDLQRIEKIEIMRSKKVKLYPNQEQQKILTQWFGANRWVYNQCVNNLNQRKDDKKIPNRKFFRDKFLNGIDKKEFANGTPYDIRDGGMIDVLKNLNSNIAKMKKKTIKHFKLEFKKIKNGTNTISVPHKYYNTNGAYKLLSDMKKSEPVHHINRDFRILKDTNGNYWMCLPITKNSRSERQAREFSTDRLDGTISLDPGVRTFMVGYDGFNEQIIHIGEDATKKIEYLCFRLDALISKKNLKTSSQNKRVRLRKGIRNIRKRIKNKVYDMHLKLCNFLCENYRTILLPKFESQKMVSNGMLHSKTARNMLTLSHYSFKQRLLSKSEEYKNCKVHIVDESYTSKTCGNCGDINSSLGSSKIFECPTLSCRTVLDRDCNGARNILIKNF
jgi:putative transposase